jgi:hypothetical protein
LNTVASTITTANLTATVNTLHVCTIAGLTAHRDFILPAVAAVGDRVGVYIADGDDTYALLIKPSSGDTINGGTAGAEWNRLFIKGEIVVFRCVDANTAWFVEHDEMVCEAAIFSASSSASTADTLPNSTFTKVDQMFETELLNTGSLYNSTDKRFDIRRDGRYLISVADSVGSAVDQTRYIMRVYKNGSVFKELFRAYVRFSFGGTAQLSGACVVDLSAGDYVEFYFMQTSGATLSSDTAGADIMCWTSINRL